MTSGNGCTISGGEQAALWSSWTRYQGHRGPSVTQEESTCGVVFEENQVGSCREELLLDGGRWLPLPPMGRFWPPRDRWEKQPPR